MEKLFIFFLDTLFKKKQDIIYRNETITENTRWSLPQGVTDISDVTFINVGTALLSINKIPVGTTGGSAIFTCSPFEKLNMEFNIEFTALPTQSTICIITYKQFQQSSLLWQ